MMKQRTLIRLGWAALAVILAGALLFAGVLAPPPQTISVSAHLELPSSPQQVPTLAPARIIAAQSSLLPINFLVNIPLVIR